MGGDQGRLGEHRAQSSDGARRQDIFHYGTAMGQRMGQAGLTNVARDADGIDVVARELGLLGADGRISLPTSRATRGGGDVVGPLGEAMGAVDYASRSAMSAYVAAQAKLQKLPEAYWLRQFKPPKLDAANGMAVDAGRVLDPEEVAAIQSNLDGLMGAGTAKVVGTDSGAWIMNRSGEANKAFHNAADRAVEGVKSLESADTTPTRFDGDFFTNDWSSQANGEGYQSAIRLAGGGSDSWLSNIENRLRSGDLSAAGDLRGAERSYAGDTSRIGAPDLSAGRLPASDVASLLERGAAP
jgi:hypothetical protein